MKIWGSIEVPKKVEFISYAPEHHGQVLKIIRHAFFKDETVSIASEIYGNEDAENDLQGLCEDILQKTGVSIVARDVDKDQIIGVSLNLIQVKQTSPEASTYFEIFRDQKCKTENAKNLMNYMIVADSRVDAFEIFSVDSLLEIMFLAVLGDYRGCGIGLNLVKYSVKLATALKNGTECDEFLAPGEPKPKLVTALWTGRATQVIGQKLGFEVIYKEPFSNFSFKERTFAERVGDLSLEYHVGAKRI